MFLLFVAEGTTRDLMVERRIKTLDRYRTLSVNLMPMFLAKSAYSLVVVTLSACIILIGGGWIFGINWQHGFAIAVLTLCYAVFCVGFAYFLVAVIYRENLASVLNTVVIMLMAFVGGGMIPTQNLPSVLRDNVSPWMPNYVFAETIKSLQFDWEGPNWISGSLVLFAVGWLLLLLAIYVFKRRLLAGVE